MGEAKRRRMIAAANARQAACGWDANGSPTVEEAPRAPQPVPTIRVDPSPRAAPALRGLLSVLAAFGTLGRDAVRTRRRW